MTKRARVLGLIALFTSGCGAAITVARVEPEHAPVAPPTFAQETIDRWAEARGAYDAALASGWDEAACADVTARFEAASAAEHGELAEAAYMIGLVRRACGDAAGASVSFHRALTLRSTLCGARVAVALEALDAGRTDEARGEVDRAVHDDGRCAEGYVLRARLERHDPSRSAAALDDLRRALAIDARSMAAFDQMALVYLDQATRARGGTERVQGGGLAPRATAHEAQTYDDAARLLDLAAVVCRQAQLVDGDYAPLYNTWALIELGRGHLVEALALLQRATTLDPALFEAWMNFGELTLSFRGYEDAADAFARASTLRPASYDAFVGLGAARRGLGQLDVAEEAYARAIAIDAARPEAYFDLGLLYQDHRGGDAASMRRAEGYYREFVARAEGSAALVPVIEAVTRTCPSSCGPEARATPRRRSRGACTMGRLQQITEALCLLESTGS